MSYFKTHPAKQLKRPVTYRVLAFQLIITFTAGMLVGFFSPINGLTVLLGGAISICGQAFYNYRALCNYGESFAPNIVASTYSAMWGKWAIIIAASLVAVLKIEELNAGVFYCSLFGVQTIGALALPILVKRVT